MTASVVVIAPVVVVLIAAIVDGTIFAKLRSDLVAIFPQLAGISFSHSWGGPISGTFDMFPALGHIGGQDWVYSLGCCGHGVSTTHLHGQTLSDLVLERDTDLTRTFFVNRRILPSPAGSLRLPALKSVINFMRWEDRRYDVLPA